MGWNRAAALLATTCLGWPAAAAAQDALPSRILEFRFTPTERTQIALWIEKADGTFQTTVKLTQAVSFHGIGNRPGAAQMNSGFRWPYGRREGVLPVWAHRRAAAPGARPFSRVIFQNRRSEGDASNASTAVSDSTADAYFCLSFNQERSTRDMLDAVSCATPFSSDKGRYLDRNDYAEPAVVGDQGMMRVMERTSLYPPRRDVTSCFGSVPGCLDTADVEHFDDDAHIVMPDIDSVTMATPAPAPQTILFSPPEDWPDGEYVAFIEVNVEGDYNGVFNAETYPTPRLPSGAWDSWAMEYGYAYRGQPSVVYTVPFVLGARGPFGTSTPAGYGDVDGFGPDGGRLYALAPGAITDDPAGAPGSGADRLLQTAAGADRFQVIGRDPAQCQMDAPPGTPADVSAAPVADEKHSHQWATLHFVVPQSASPIAHYDVRVAKSEIVADDVASFMRAQPAMAAMIDSQALMIPTSNGAGVGIDVDFGGLEPTTRYWVAIRAVNLCNMPGPFAVAEVTTTRVNYTQLGGCFVATAAYGSPLEPDVAALRSVRDALRPRSVLAATATEVYYQAGPAAADLIARSDVARAYARTLLGPIVELARAANAGALSGQGQLYLPR